MRLRLLLTAFLLAAVPALADTTLNGPIVFGTGLNVTGNRVTVTVGTVSSVGLSLPSVFTVSGSPVTGTGTLTGNLATQSANTLFAGPVGGAAAAPTFRAIVTADYPAGSITYAKIQNETASTILGNPTGIASAPREVTLGTGLSFSGGAILSTTPAGGAITPLFDNGANGFTNGTRSGNTTTVATTAGVLIDTHCMAADANGNIIDAGGICTTGGGGGTVTSGTGPAIAQYSAGTGTVVGSATISGDATLAQGGALTVSSIGGKAVSLANSLTTTGNFALTLIQTAATVATLPAGTHSLAPLDGPVFTLPTLGVASATSVNKVTITPPATGSTLTIADGKTLTDTSPAGAVALKGTSGGGFAQAACGDLSNGATGCSTAVGTAATANTGTSGHTLPYLDAAATYSGGLRQFGATAPVHLASGQTTQPALTGCGGSAGFLTASTDTAGTILPTNGATSCTLTFNVAYVTAPHCAVTWRGNPLAVQNYSVSSTQIVINQTAANTIIDYVCVAPSGG